MFTYFFYIQDMSALFIFYHKDIFYIEGKTDTLNFNIIP